MNFDEYQKKAFTTAVYPSLWIENEISPHPARKVSWVYPAMKLSGEAGEVCEKLGKIIRDDLGNISDEKRLALKKELGDVLWYVAALATELGFSLNDVAAENLRKLAQRKIEGKIHGEGDNR